MDRIRVVATALLAVVALLGLTVDAFAESEAAQAVGPVEGRVEDGIDGPVGSPVAESVADPAGAWAWPLVPRPDVVAGFDPPTTPYGPGHVGVDLLGWPGQTVLSVAAGEVLFAGQVAGTPVVSVLHGGERSTYQPVVATVRRGESVARGQPIGTLSNVGGHCLPLTCLHLGRRAGDAYLDPLEMLGGGPVRLLPGTGELVDWQASDVASGVHAPGVLSGTTGPIPQSDPITQRVALDIDPAARHALRQGLKLGET